MQLAQHPVDLQWRFEIARHYALSLCIWSYWLSEGQFTLSFVEFLLCSKGWGCYSEDVVLVPTVIENIVCLLVTLNVLVAKEVRDLLVYGWWEQQVVCRQFQIAWNVRSLTLNERMRLLGIKLFVSVSLRKLQTFLALTVKVEHAWVHELLWLDSWHRLHLGRRLN